MCPEKEDLNKLKGFRQGRPNDTMVLQRRISKQVGKLKKCIQKITPIS